MEESRLRRFPGREDDVYKPYSERDIRQLVTDLERKYGLGLTGEDGRDPRLEVQGIVEVGYIVARRKATPSEPMPEWREFVGMCEGDAASRFHDRHARKVHRIVRRKFPNLASDECGDAVNKTYADAVELCELGRGGRLFAFWIQRAVWRCLDALDTLETRETLLSALALEAGASPSTGRHAGSEGTARAPRRWEASAPPLASQLEAIEGRMADFRAVFEQAYAALTDRQRERLAMHDLGFSDEEIAMREGVSPSTISEDRSRARRAVKDDCALRGYLVVGSDATEPEDFVLEPMGEKHVRVYRRSGDVRER